MEDDGRPRLEVGHVSHEPRRRKVPTLVRNDQNLEDQQYFDPKPVQHCVALKSHHFHRQSR